MKTLNNAQTKRREELAAQLHEGMTQLEANYSILVDMINDYNKEVDTFNGLVEEAREFTTEIAGNMESYINDKSEKWQESDSGTEYGEWRDAWQDIELEDLESVEVPTNPTDTSSSGIPDALKALPSEPG